MIITETEAGFQATIIDLAERMGARVYHVRNVKGQLSNETGRGFPDLLIAHDAFGCWFIEVKSATGKLTDDQVAWQVLLGKALKVGVDVDIWRPKDWPTLKGLLTGMRSIGR